jgi:hypothetical protein
MVIHENGKVEGAGEVKDLRKLQKRVKAYVGGFCEALYAGEIGKPGPGDCFYCSMKEERSGRPLGEVARDEGHILSHMEEKYYVPSLLTNALEEMGASQAVRHCVGFWMGYHDQEAGSWEGIAKKDVPKMLTRYVRRQLGLAK